MSVQNKVWWGFTAIESDFINHPRNRFKPMPFVLVKFADYGRSNFNGIRLKLLVFIDVLHLCNKAI